MVYKVQSDLLMSKYPEHWAAVLSDFLNKAEIQIGKKVNFVKRSNGKI